MLGLTQIQTAIVVAGLAIVLAGGTVLYIFKQGERTGSAAVTTAVQQNAIRTLDAARISKERTDEEVRRTPYDDRADGLR